MSDNAEVQKEPAVPAVAKKAEGAEEDPKIDVTESDAEEPKAAAPPDEPANADADADATASANGDASAGADADADVPEIEAGPGEPPPVPPAVRKQSILPPREWPPKTVADIMTRKVITLLETEPVGELEEWMTRFRFRHLPVVGAGGKLVGLITRTDLLHAMLGRGPAGQPIEPANAATPASAIMNRNVITAHPDAALNTACRAMLQEKLSCLPVIADDQTLVGILTDTDYVRLAAEVLDRFAAG